MLGTFTCITNNGDDIRWIVDGTAHNFYDVMDRRMINTTIQPPHNNMQESSTSIPAIDVNQHILHIKCRAYITEGTFQFVESNETAQYNIQGLLQPPSNITVKSFNATSNIIEWIAPETLDITNIEPDIENYTICINISHSCVNTSTSHFFLPKYSSIVEVFITAWNIVGESSASMPVILDACSMGEPIGSKWK